VNGEKGRRQEPEFRSQKLGRAANIEWRRAKKGEGLWAMGEGGWAKKKKF
jgi:hypothetical protein